MKIVALVVFNLLLFISCNKEINNKHSIDNDLIINYLSQNNIEAYHYTDGLYYSILSESKNTSFPTENSTVRIKYKGYLADGTVIDSSDNEFVKVCLTECIEGLKLGIPLFSKNSKGLLLVPSHLAYGEFETNNIPANSVIIYEIELKDFQN